MIRARERRRLVAGALLRGGGVAGVGLSGVPGLVLAWDLAAEDQHQTGKPPAGVVRVREGCGGAHREGGDSAVAELADEQRPGS